MKAIVWDRSGGFLKTAQIPEPEVTVSDEVKARVISTGVCGTDREVLSRKGFMPPSNSGYLVTGHEVLARLVGTGPAVRGLKPGDFVTFTIRRGCDECGPCLSGRPDMCVTGRYAERGLDRVDGFNSEFVVDREVNCLRVPDHMARLGVLCEPFSTVQKALNEAQEAARRLPGAFDNASWFEGRRCLVIGLGPIGLLASMALQLRGARVWGVDIVDERSVRPRWLEAIGGKYIDGRKAKPEKIEKTSNGKFGFMFQATGSPEAACGLLRLLAPNGVFVFFASGRGRIRADAGLLTGIIDGNQTLIGSISSEKRHFTMALNDLEYAEFKWPGQAGRLITGEFAPVDFKKAYRDEPSRHIKTVLAWGALAESP